MTRAERLQRDYEERVDNLPPNIREEWLQHEGTKLMLLWAQGNLELMKEAMLEGVFMDSYPEAVARAGAIQDLIDHIHYNGGNLNQ